MTPARFPLAWGSMLGAGLALASLAAAAACGSKTGLGIDDTLDDGGPDAFTRINGRDGPAPPLDVAPRPDVVRTDCPDAAATLIYVITTSNALYSYDPAAASFARIGTIRCRASADAHPFSMAVDRKGIAYVLFDDNSLFRVSTATALCTPTPFVPNSDPFLLQFGMGFASDTNGAPETLYIAGDTRSSGQPVQPPSPLASIDVRSLQTRRIGLFDPRVHSAELTGTGAGRLYAFYAIASTQSGDDVPTAIGEIDKTSGALLGEALLPNVYLQRHWAFGFWGGDFYMFTGPNGTSQVTRFRPADGSVTVVASLADEIVGAGVSTCAPEN